MESNRIYSSEHIGGSKNWSCKHWECKIQSYFFFKWVEAWASKLFVLVSVVALFSIFESPLRSRANWFIPVVTSFAVRKCEPLFTFSKFPEHVSAILPLSAVLIDLTSLFEFSEMRITIFSCIWVSSRWVRWRYLPVCWVGFVRLIFPFIFLFLAAEPLDFSIVITPKRASSLANGGVPASSSWVFLIVILHHVLNTNLITLNLSTLNTSTIEKIRNTTAIVVSLTGHWLCFFA